MSSLLTLLPSRAGLQKVIGQGAQLHREQRQAVLEIDPVMLTSAIQRLAGERTSEPSLDELRAVWQLAESCRRERDDARSLATSLKAANLELRSVVDHLLKSGYERKR